MDCGIGRLSVKSLVEALGSSVYLYQETPLALVLRIGVGIGIGIGIGIGSMQTVQGSLIVCATANHPARSRTKESYALCSPKNDLKIPPLSGYKVPYNPWASACPWAFYAHRSYSSSFLSLSFSPRNLIVAGQVEKVHSFQSGR